MQTTTKNFQSILPILFVIPIGILSTATPNFVLQLMFLTCGVCGVILFFCKDLIKDEKKRRIFLYLTGIVFSAILLWSILSVGSLTAYGTKVQSFFQRKATDNSLDTIYQEMSEERLSMAREISGADKTIIQIIEELEQSSTTLAEYQFLFSKYDPEEVERLATDFRKKLDEDAEQETSYFSNIKTNIQTLELFYKMRCSCDVYHYYNCIKALESIGINCEKMSIDEYDLMLWDVEYLFTIYSIRQDRLEDAAQDVVYEEKQVFYYQDFKIYADEHSDTFDYKNWNRWFDVQSAKELVQSLDDEIMTYYKKFHMNFQKALIE